VIEPTVAFPPATPFTLQVTALSELPVTVAEYCDWAPSVTVVGPDKSIEIGVVASAAQAPALVTVSPQAVSSNAKDVVRIAQVRGRQFERISLPSSGHYGMPKNVRRETARFAG
jgi:hypothetical protein